MQIFDTPEEVAFHAGNYFCEKVEECLSENPTCHVTFASGATQIPFLKYVTSMKEIQWDRIVGYQLDEIIGDAPTFRPFFEDHLLSKVHLAAFYFMNYAPDDLTEYCKYYADLSIPSSIVILGIGQNGHVAFNEPTSKLTSEGAVKIVKLAPTTLRSIHQKSDDVIYGLTTSIEGINRNATKIIMATGTSKYRALRDELAPVYSVENPEFFIDKEAYSGNSR